MADQVLTASTSLRDLPRGIWALGFVSMFMDLSSEMIHALLPIYLVTVLGSSTLTVGLIEGLAEATAMITKIFSGALSDWLGRRKLLAVIGYGLAAFTKPIFPLAITIEWVVTARLLDRVGKGLRGAPRDALVADLAPAPLRGASFGLRQSLDTTGAFLGPLAAIAFMLLTGDNYAAVFWIAVIPAFVAFGLIAFGVKDAKPAIGAAIRPKPKIANAWRLPRPFWAVVAVAVVLTLARFSEAFLVLRAQNAGLTIAIVPIVMVVMNIAYALAAYPAGVLSDRFGRQGVLIVGVATLAVADLLLAFTTSVPILLLGVVFWGLHMGLTQGLLAALVADTAPADLRGTAFGVFNLVSGVAMLVASVIAGALWDVYGPIATFLAGTAFTAVALAGLLGLRKQFRTDFSQGPSST